MYKMDSSIPLLHHLLQLLLLHLQQLVNLIPLIVHHLNQLLQFVIVFHLIHFHAVIDFVLVIN